MLVSLHYRTPIQFIALVNAGKDLIWLDVTELAAFASARNLGGGSGGDKAQAES